MSNSLKRPLNDEEVSVNTEETKTEKKQSAKEMARVIARSPKHNPTQIGGAMEKLSLLATPLSLMTKLAQSLSTQLDQLYQETHQHNAQHQHGGNTHTRPGKSAS